MGAFEGLYPIRPGIRSAREVDYWDVIYDYKTVPMVGGGEFMRRKVERFYSLEEAKSYAKDKVNAEITQYVELEYD